MFKQNSLYRRTTLTCALMTSVALAGYSATGYAHETVEADGSVELDFAHGGGSDGHIPANVNYGFELVGTNGLEGTTDGKYTDVWYHNGYAYVGSFQNPDCTRSGAYVVDMADPTNPVMVAEIKSPPGTRYNDVKAHTIGGKDYLFTTSEKCGDLVGNGRAVGGGNGGHQKGQGGINVYNVTDATKPHAVKLNMLDFQTHNTFPWTDGANSYLMVVDDENLNDVHIVDITKPQSPKLIATTGIGDWIGNTDVAADGQLFTGVFATPLLHDIWVEQVNGQWQAILSYWDAGFITLDVSDPYNPAYIGDSTYPATDPVMGVSPMEGNAHAAVFGGDSNQYIFGGDEDFDPVQVGITVTSTSQFIPASQGSDVPQVGPGADVPSLSGATTYVGLACNPIPRAAHEEDIAIIQRGACAFTTKAGNAEAAGYAGAIVFNHATGCNASVSMAVEAGIPALFVPREFGFDILGIGGYDPATCDGSGSDNGDALLAGAESTAGLGIDISGVFDGWGYFHVLNNTQGDVTVPYGMAKDPSSGEYLETRTLGYLGHIGYYAPAEAADPDKASGFGDLTMHNVETDPMQRDRSYLSWYSAGMRALEYRPGHLHNNLNGEGSYSWNVHEVGRWIDPRGSNFWGVTVANIGGEQYILASDRNFGLYVFKWECEGRQGEQGNDALYCDPDL